MNGSKTLERAFDILFILAESESTMTVKELAKAAKIPESSTYRFLQTMEKNGVIERHHGQIKLGLRILELARVLNNQMDNELDIIAKPIMEKLTDITGETSILAVRTGYKIISIEQTESKKLIRTTVNKGRTLPLHQGASGKVILAFEDKQIIEKVMESLQNEKAATQLNDDLTNIRESGYCLTLGEVDEGIVGIAAPIFDKQNRVAASLSIVGFKSSLNDSSMDAVINEVVNAAKEITEQLQSLIEI